METKPEPPGSLGVALRIVWGLIFLVLAAAAFGWWLHMPRGFPLSHPRFWMNPVLSLVAMHLCALGILALRRNRLVFSQLLMCAIPAAIFGAGLSWVIFFSKSQPWRPFNLFLLLGMLLIFLERFTTRRLGVRKLSRWARAATFIVAFAIGGFIPWSQRGPDPTTLPLNAAMPVVDQEDLATIPPALILSDDFIVLPSSGQISVKCGEATVEIDPFLQFKDFSPDRCWTIFSGYPWMVDKEAPLVAMTQDDEAILLNHQYRYNRGLLAFPLDHMLRITTPRPDRELTFEAFTDVTEPVYSHLNLFCMLVVSPRGKLSVAFSPCPDDRDAGR